MVDAASPLAVGMLSAQQFVSARLQHKIGELRADYFRIRIFDVESLAYNAFAVGGRD